MRVFFAGGGHCSEYISQRLIREGHDVVLIEQDEQRHARLKEALDAHVVLGNVSSIDDWRSVGVEKSELFVACTRSDELNVLSCLIANEVAPDAIKAIRLRTPEFEQWKRMLQDLGVRVDRVIHPESDVSARILRVLSVPGVSDIRDFADGRFKLFGMNARPDAWFTGMPVSEIGITGKDGFHGKLCLIFRDGRTIVPTQDDKLKAGDHLYVVTTADRLDDALTHMGISRREKVKQVFIVGGGEVGLSLAKELESRRISVKLFELDTRRCEFLAAQLTDAVVINADGTDQMTLIREGLDEVDAFIALTRDDDANLIACMLARRYGVSKVAPLLNRLNYIPLAQRLGINTTGSNRVKAADAVLEYVRKGGVVSVRTLGEEGAEAIELVVPHGCGYAGKPVRDIKLPPGTALGAIARPTGELLIPGDNTVIAADDRAIFFAMEGAVKKLEDEILGSEGQSGLWRVR
ncbi:MAG: Trk system potassium transporter TrkA [Gammaproteobacteria bacterium]|jgi:trk system potassium uptake protein TrkA